MPGARNPSKPETEPSVAASEKRQRVGPRLQKVCEEFGCDPGVVGGPLSDFKSRK